MSNVKASSLQLSQYLHFPIHPVPALGKEEIRFLLFEFFFGSYEVFLDIYFKNISLLYKLLSDYLCSQQFQLSCFPYYLTPYSCG